MFWNYVLCVLSMLCIIGEIFLILKRNRKVQLRGKDDFFTFSLVVFFAIIIFPLAEMSSMVENIRNILILGAIFGTAGIRRGFSEKGMEKVCYTIAWEQIKTVRINEYQTSKIQVICQTARGKHKLLFSKHLLKEVLRLKEKHVPDIYIQSALENTLQTKKCGI